MPDQGQIAEVDILRAFLSASEAALALVSSDGTVRYTSERAQSLYGTLLGPLVGRQIFELVTEPSAKLLKAHFANMVANELPRLEIALPLAGLTNRTVRFEIINGHNIGALNGFVMFIREIVEAPPSQHGQELRPKIETLLSKTLERFANASIGSTERDLHESLEGFCELAGIERAMLWVLDESGRRREGPERGPNADG